MDNYNLERFVQAQESRYDGYADALEQIHNGRKTSHWIWYIFPQIKGLGQSKMSETYGISGIEEAQEYIEHSVLGERLREISEALLELETNRIEDVMDWPDPLKLKSSMSLFAQAAPEEKVFNEVLCKFFGGSQDIRTLWLLEHPGELD